jgi:hypothetical protein
VILTFHEKIFLHQGKTTIIAMAIKNTKIVIPAEAGISSMPNYGLQEYHGFRRDDGGDGLFG